METSFQIKSLKEQIDKSYSELCSSNGCLKCKYKGFHCFFDYALEYLNVRGMLNLNVQNPDVWKDVKVNDPVYVKESESDIWIVRHFAYFKDGIVYTWTSGCTNYTTSATIAWQYAKPYIEGEKA